MDVPLSSKVSNDLSRVRSNAASFLLVQDEAFGDSGTVLVADALKFNTSVASLQLCKCGIGPRGAAILADMLSKNATITELALCGNEIGDAGALHIADALKKNRTLSYLDLRRSGLSGKGCRAVIQSMGPTLSSLNLSHNALLNDGMAMVAGAIRGNYSLNMLYLANCCIELHDGARAVADILKYASELMVLDLSGNLILESGAAVVGNALMKNKTLRSLNLRGCNIGGLGCQTIANVLDGLGSFTGIDRSSTFVSFRESVMSNFVLTEVLVDDDFVEGLEEVIDRNQERVRMLFSAVTREDLSIVKKLFSEGVCVSELQDKKTILHAACETGNVDVIELVLRHASVCLFVCGGLGKGVRPVRDMLMEYQEEKRPIFSFVLSAFPSISLEELEELMQNRSLRHVLVKNAAWVDMVKVSCSKAGLISLLVVENIRFGMGADFIQWVDYSNYDCEYMPAWFSRLSLKTRLHFDGNPLSIIPEDAKKNSTSLLTYLKNLTAGKHVWRKAKVMVLGKEGVGKSHILHRLRKGNAKYEDISTNGLAVKEFAIGDMELTWFDFGGQEVFYPTHQFFLTGHCVYLVVFSFAEDSVDRVKHWLSIVDHFARDPKRPAKIVLVGTHADSVKLNKREAIWGLLRPILLTYGAVVGCVEVSCTKGTGFDELVERLRRAIELGNLGRIEIPVYYLEVWLKLRQSKVKRYSWEEFCSMFPHLRGSGSYDQLEYACRFFSEVGVCFFSKKEDLGVVIPDLQYLADLFKGVVSFYSGAIDGVVRLQSLMNQWKISHKEVRVNMELLERFEIAYPKVEDDAWVIPSMLKERSAEPLRVSSLSKKKVHERIFRMIGSVPPGLIGRLIVRVQAMKEVVVTDLWRSGIALKLHDKDEGSIVLKGSDLVVRTESTGVVEHHLIHLLSEQCRTMATNIFRNRDARMLFEEFIVCPHCLEKRVHEPLKISKEACVDMLIHGVESFVCGLDTVLVRNLGQDLTACAQILENVFVDEEPFASGGFGVIYLAKWNGVTVVAKELNPSKAKLFHAAKENGNVQLLPLNVKGEDENYLDLLQSGFDEFQHEVSIMSRLQHANIVRLYGILLNPLMMILEYCDGGDLCQAIARGVVWKKESLELRLVLDIAKGLAFLHGQNPAIAHRDLRSPNVFLVSLNPTDPVCAKLADFGMSVLVTAKQRKALGTWMWMAPEAQKGENYSETCDLYSFAIIANEILSKQLPFVEEFADERPEKLKWKVFEGLRPSIPERTLPWLRELIENMWADSPLERPSAADCVAWIETKGEKRPHKKSFHRVEEECVRVRVVFEKREGAVTCMSVGGSCEMVWVGTKTGEVLAVVTNVLTVARREVHGAFRVSALCAIGNGCVSAGDDRTLKYWRGAFSEKKEIFKKMPLSELLEVRLSKSVESFIFIGVITAILDTPDAIFYGSATKGLRVVPHDTAIAPSQLELTSSVCCICPVGNRRIWIGAGSSITETGLNLADSTIIAESAHGTVTSIVAISESVVWSCGRDGDVAVWSLEGNRCVERFVLDSKCRSRCMLVVEMNGNPTVWFGCDDMVVLVDVRTRRSIRTISLPLTPGEVTCMATTGLGAVWLGVRNRGNRGSIYAVHID